MRIATIKLIVISVLLPLVSLSKKPSQLVLKDIWYSRSMQLSYASSFKWMNDSQFYTQLKREKTRTLLIRYKTLSNEVADTILQLDSSYSVSAYAFSPQEKYILLTVSAERIYRRSAKKEMLLIPIHATDQYIDFAEGKKIQEPTFSPNENKIAYVYENNIYAYDIATQQTQQITSDGEKNTIINGHADWVYEEEFGFTRAFYWSPDSKKIAYLRFDETDVPTYTMQRWGDGLYPENYTFKYPKAGEKNAELLVKCYDLTSEQDEVLLNETRNDNYIPKLQWASEATVSVVRMNRLQNKLEIIHIDTEAKEENQVYQENSETYVNLPDIVYLNGDTVVFTSEKSGYKHVHQLAVSSGKEKQLTKGQWELGIFWKLDKANRRLFYSSTQDSPLERQLYTTSIDTFSPERLTKEEGFHHTSFSPDFKYFKDSYSSVEKPWETNLRDVKTGKKIKVLSENDQFQSIIQKYQLTQPQFFSFTGPSGDTLNGNIQYPSNFKKNKKYPVLMYVYGGPGVQTVKNIWAGTNYLWNQYLTQQGYIVVSIDNRGTGGRGRDFTHATYGQLGKLEVEDQIAGAKYLATLPYVDKDRIGIWGWSYGGYMSSLCILLGADVFKTAIAVAPVSNWKYYDTVYSERYLKTPKENEKGYTDYSPVYHTDSLKGNFLLIHGTGDDNVHVQNAMALQKALIESGKQFDSFFYPDKNHSIYGGNTRFHLYQKMTDYILKKL